VPLVVGIDSDQVRIGLAGSLDGTGSMPYLLGDFMDCPFPPVSFDLITSIATLHHMPADSALTRMPELLKPGGTLAIIGLARSGIIGLPFELARAIATRLHTHRKGCWNHPSPIVWPPPLSYRQMRHIAAVRLPGVQYRRHVLWRYSLWWTKPARSCCELDALGGCFGARAAALSMRCRSSAPKRVARGPRPRRCGRW